MDSIDMNRVLLHAIHNNVIKQIISKKSRLTQLQRFILHS